MKVSIASDHAGFELKNKIIEKLKIKGCQVVDCGCFSKESCAVDAVLLSGVKRFLYALTDLSLMLMGISEY